MHYGARNCQIPTLIFLLSQNIRVERDLAFDRFMGTNWNEQSLGSSRQLYRSDDDPASRNSPLLADGDE